MNRHHGLGGTAAAIVFAAWCAGVASGATIHVSPQGDDTAAGTAERPLCTMAGAIARATADAGPHEIVVHEGVYPGSVTIPDSEDESPLVISAGKRADGSWEDAILDGSVSLKESTPAEGAPRAFRFDQKVNRRYDYSVWEEDTRIRYQSVSDVQAVVQMPATFVLTDTEVFFSTSDGRSPAEHRVAMARNICGLTILRANVTVRGLQFRSFAVSDASAGINVRKANVTVEDCRFWNSNRGVSASVGADNLRMLRCRVDDVAAGIKSLALDLLVEDCLFFRKPGRFEIDEYSQNQSGVQVYHPGSRATVRRTLCVGFQLGFFFKCVPGRFVCEQNTLVIHGAENTPNVMGMGCTAWFPESVFRGNVVAGFDMPVVSESAVVEGAVVDENCLWQGGAARTIAKLAEIGAGKRNVNADPLFAAPEEDDYRIRAAGPAARLLGGGPAGAFGIVDDKPLALLPAVKGALDVIAPPRPGLTPPKAAEFVLRQGPARTWCVDPVVGVDKPVVGTEEKPLRSLQTALNHANPGDRVLLRPGIYFGPHMLNHGGTKYAPITIEASEPGVAILDGIKQYEEANLLLKDAPHVVVRGLEVRWFAAQGILLQNSSGVRIEDCTFWNDHWVRGRYIGEGIAGQDSPELTVERCVMFACNRPIRLDRSPRFTIVHNTLAMGLHQAVVFGNSGAGSVFRNNSVAFGGSYIMGFYPSTELPTFECDYNNWGANVRADSTDQPARDEVIRHTPGDFFVSKPTKAIIVIDGKQRYGGLRAWQKASGKDTHSIFQHPRYADPRNRDFRLRPDSPNIGAGENGTNIGALGALTTR